MIPNRVIIIKTAEDDFFVGHRWEFNSEKHRDSEALHILLCECQPGDTYTVEFKNL